MIVSGSVLLRASVRNSETCTSPNDCDNPGECAAADCIQNACIVTNDDPGTDCSAGVCDGDGACVDCLVNDDCETDEVCSDQNSCVPGSCEDDEQNESDARRQPAHTHTSSAGIMDLCRRACNLSQSGSLTLPRPNSEHRGIGTIGFRPVRVGGRGVILAMEDVDANAPRRADWHRAVVRVDAP